MNDEQDESDDIIRADEEDDNVDPRKGVYTASLTKKAQKNDNIVPSLVTSKSLENGVVPKRSTKSRTQSQPPLIALDEIKFELGSPRDEQLNT